MSIRGASEEGERRTIWLSCTVDSFTSWPIPIVIYPPCLTHPSALPQPKQRLTHILEKLHLRREALQRLVILPLEVVRKALPGLVRVSPVPAAGAAAKGRRAAGRWRRVVLVRTQERRAVVQLAVRVRGSVPATRRFSGRASNRVWRRHTSGPCRASVTRSS